MTDIVEVLSEHIAASEHDHPSGADAYISDASVAELRVAVATILSLRLKLEELEKGKHQAKIDTGILLANLDYLEEATGEGPEDEDRAMVEQIRKEWGHAKG